MEQRFVSPDKIPEGIKEALPILLENRRRYEELIGIKNPTVAQVGLIDVGKQWKREWSGFCGLNYLHWKYWMQRVTGNKIGAELLLGLIRYFDPNEFMTLGRSPINDLGDMDEPPEEVLERDRMMSLPETWQRLADGAEIHFRHEKAIIVKSFTIETDDFKNPYEESALDKACREVEERGLFPAPRWCR